MIEIINGLFLGNRQAASNRPHLQDAGVTHIVNCTEELPCLFEGSFRYLHLRLTDPDTAFQGWLPKVCAFIDEGRQSGKVLVHCYAAVSRSPATILAYLCHLGQPIEEAARHLGRVVWTDPDHSFLHQLATFRGLNWDEEARQRVSDLLRGTDPPSAFPGEPAT